MSRPNRNGVGSATENPARRNRGRGGFLAEKANRAEAAVVLAGSRAPLGKPPQRRGKKWTWLWNRICAECPWLDESHRRYVVSVIDLLLEFEEIHDYFDARKKRMEKEGKLPADAYLTDDGRARHPMAVQRIAVGEALRKALSLLGGTPQSQTRMVETIRQQKAADANNVTGYFDS